MLCKGLFSVCHVIIFKELSSPKECDMLTVEEPSQLSSDTLNNALEGTSQNDDSAVFSNGMVLGLIVILQAYILLMFIMQCSDDDVENIYYPTEMVIIIHCC